MQDCKGVSRDFPDGKLSLRSELLQGEAKAMVLEEAKNAAFGLLLVRAFWPNINLTGHPFSLGMQVVPKCTSSLPYSLLGLEGTLSSSPFSRQFAASPEKLFLG